jgi:hypothetical protein
MLGLLVVILLAGCGPAETGEAPRRVWNFPAEGVERVVIKSWRGAEVQRSAGSGQPITISARPVLQATDPHGPEPDWSTKKAEDWPFEWEAVTEGKTLVLRSRGEARFPHYRYVLEELEIKAPPGISVTGERQELAPVAEPPAEPGH